MGFEGKVVLFVEGQTASRPRRADPLNVIWQNHLVSALKLQKIDRVVPINKKNLLLMDPDLPISGVGNIALDKRIAKELEVSPFDVALIAWDLHPAWSKDPDMCLRDEVLRLYRGIASSTALHDSWKRIASIRLEALLNRRVGHRLRKPVLKNGTVLTLCMEPTFESLLMSSEQVMRDLFEVKDGGRIEWPTWSSFAGKPEDLIQRCIKSAARIRPKPTILKIIGGDMITAKNEWGEFLLRTILRDEAASLALKQNSISKQLMRVLS